MDFTSTRPDMPPHFALAILPPVLFIAYLAVFQRKRLVDGNSLK